MKNNLLIITLFITVLSFSQQKSTAANTISISSSGSAFVKPNIVKISLSINSSNLDYSKCIEELNTRTNKFTNLVQQTGIIKPDNIKTTNYSIRSDYQYDERTRAQTFVGYIANHNLIISLDNTKENINSILRSLSNELSNIDFSLSYETTDSDKMKDKALTNCIANAKAKAKLIAKASGITLLKILDINYRTAYQPIPRSYSSGMLSMRRSEGMNSGGLDSYAPEDIEFKEDITITWSIK